MGYLVCVALGALVGFLAGRGLERTRQRKIELAEQEAAKVVAREVEKHVASLPRDELLSRLRGDPVNVDHAERDTFHI